MGSTAVKTGLVRASYPAVFHPKSMEHDDGDSSSKYGLCIIIKKSDKVTVKALKEAIAEAWKAGMAKGYFKTEKIPALKNPLKDGDLPNEDGVTDPTLEDCYFINSYSNNKPGLIDKYGEAITSPDVFYPGCFCRVTLNFYPYGKGKKGVAAGLNNIQKLKEGERLDGRKSAESDFDDDYASAFEDEDDDDYTPSAKKKKVVEEDDFDDL